MKSVIEIIKSDITKLSVDAVVNAANSSLMGGGGVDGAIHRAGGKIILEQCQNIIKSIGRCNTGEAVVTTAGNMPSKFVIHTVGPVWNENSSDEKKELYKNQLRNCYLNSLLKASENACRTIAFPNISTGVYRFPKNIAAQIALDEVRKYLDKNNNIIDKVIFVCFDDENYNIMQSLIKIY